MRKQRHRSAAKRISAFVFATWIVQYLYFQNQTFPASSHLQWQFCPVCVRPGQNPQRWFSHILTQMSGNCKTMLFDRKEITVRIKELSFISSQKVVQEKESQRLK